jgi:hypothetical protein
MRVSGIILTPLFIDNKVQKHLFFCIFGFKVGESSLEISIIVSFFLLCLKMCLQLFCEFIDFVIIEGLILLIVPIILSVGLTLIIPSGYSFDTVFLGNCVDGIFLRLPIFIVTATRSDTVDPRRTHVDLVGPHVNRLYSTSKPVSCLKYLDGETAFHGLLCGTQTSGTCSDDNHVEVAILFTSDNGLSTYLRLSGDLYVR